MLSSKYASYKQMGGTCTSMIDNIVGCHITSGEEESGLGRWTYRLFTIKGRTDVSIHKEWDSNTLTLVKQWKAQGAKFALVMDANVGLEEKALGELITTTEIYDLMSSHHGHQSSNTHMDRSNTIEFIFGTKGILGATEKVGMLKFIMK
eukprot:15340178-Ditylum_brightwellii.AAC.1